MRKASTAIRTWSSSSLLLFAAVVQAAPPNPGFRLPDAVSPLKYSLTLNIDPQKGEFSGTEQIDVELHTRTQTIWLNAKDIAIDRAEIVIDGASPAPLHWRNIGEELLALDAPSEIGPAKSIALLLSYKARLSDTQAIGPYRRKVEGNWYAYTTFTPIEASRAFPCFDEPRFKTPWEISVRVPEGMSAFSNAPQESAESVSNGFTLFRFASTKPLPSEVVAFAVGPFDVYTGLHVRVITPKGHAAEGRAAEEAAGQVMPRLEAYTGIPYPFEKLDLLALPQNAYGAVENPGLITFLSSRLLVDSKDAAKTLDLRKLEAHEIAHQWFGDLVTQADWRDVWLSEGIATWLGNKVIDEERAPERRMLEFITQRERIMQADLTTPGRPVRLPISNRAQVQDVYNRLVYTKGAAILAMVEGWLGEENVRHAMRGYLNAHSFGVASTADLADALRAQTGPDPTEVLDSFLDTPGVPKVRAKLLCGAKPRLQIEQMGSRATPVCFKVPGGAQCAVVNGSSQEVRLSFCPAWIYLNANGTGYYRTEWASRSLAALRSGLNDLTLAEKLTLVFDLRAQKARGPEAKAIITILAGEPDPALSAPASAVLKTFN
jgi:alanyl aminopeptidase